MKFKVLFLLLSFNFLLKPSEEIFKQGELKINIIKIRDRVLVFGVGFGMGLVPVAWPAILPLGAMLTDPDKEENFTDAKFFFTGAASGVITFTGLVIIAGKKIYNKIKKS